MCVCAACGRQVKKSKHSCDKHYATCKNQRTGLGDWVEQWLTSWGLTKDKYVEAKKKFGLPPTCGCDSRKIYLNKIGEYFGISADKYGPKRRGREQE